MKLYEAYLKEIVDRSKIGLGPKPIDQADLVVEIIDIILGPKCSNREDALKHFVYNTLPGTTDAASVKAKFLKNLILEHDTIEEIDRNLAFELLSHMKGGPSVEVLLDLAFDKDAEIAEQAAGVLKTQVFLYETDTIRLEKEFNAGNPVAQDILESYLKAEFFTKLKAIPEKIKVVTYVAAEGDISTDLLSPGNQAHSRSDRELHGQCFISKQAQNEITKLKSDHPEKSIMLVAEKGTMGVGSSRMSGVNNVALWTGKKASPYIPYVNVAPIVAGTNGISPIFLTTVGVTGGIGIDLKNWVKKKDSDGNVILNNDGEAILEQAYSVETGTVFTINTQKKKLYDGDENRELANISSSFTDQKVEFMKAGGSYSIVFGKKLQNFASRVLKKDSVTVFASPREIHHDNQGLTAVEKIFNKNAVGLTNDINLFACLLYTSPSPRDRQKSRMPSSA